MGLHTQINLKAIVSKMLKRVILSQCFILPVFAM